MAGSGRQCSVWERPRGAERLYGGNGRGEARTGVGVPRMMFRQPGPLIPSTHLHPPADHLARDAIQADRFGEQTEPIQQNVCRDPTRCQFARVVNGGGSRY
jgi:hypothetical protein